MNQQVRLIVIVLILVVGINIVLGLFFFKPNKKLNSTSAPKTFSVTQLKPLSAGNPFSAPVLNPGGKTALYTISGRIVDYVNTPNKDGYLIKILKDNGQYLTETPFAPRNLRPTVVSRDGTQKEIHMSEVNKGDYAVISLNIKVNTKEVVVTGIHITR